MVYSLRTQFLYYIYCTLLAHLSYTAHIQQLLNILYYTTLYILPHLYSHYLIHLYYHMHNCILCITLYIYIRDRFLHYIVIYTTHYICTLPYIQYYTLYTLGYTGFYKGFSANLVRGVGGALLLVGYDEGKVIIMTFY